jgi:hypothetical protein
MLAAVEAYRVIAAGEHHPLHIRKPGRFEDIVGADDVRAEDRLPGPLDRIGAEMGDAVHALDGIGDGGRIGEVAGDRLFTLARVRDRLAVEQAQLVVGSQQRPQHARRHAGSAGQQDQFGGH